MEKTESRDEILKSISSLLDEAISDYQKLEKADYKMQPDENGDMPAKAGQEGDDFIKPLKKEDEKKDDEKKDEDEKKDDEDKPEDKKEEPVIEMKKEDDKKVEDKKEDEDKKDDEDDDEKDYGKFMKFFQKALFDLKLIKTDEELEVEEPIEKSIKDESPLLKSLGDKMENLEKKIEKVTEAVDKIANSPAVPTKRSLDGLSAIKKSTDENEAPKLSKSQNLNKLLDLQKSGDPRVSANFIAKYEVLGNDEMLKGIIN